MPFISLPEGVPGILGPLAAYPEIAQYLNPFTQQLLRGDSSLTAAERELLASVVSRANDCTFCTRAHAATARALAPDEADVIDDAVFRAERDKLKPKMQALVDIALAVQQSGNAVTPAMIETAKKEGADEKAIHDTVLIAAAFCMFNRYVDGLGTYTPDAPEVYQGIGARLAAVGYGSEPK